MKFVFGRLLLTVFLLFFNIRFAQAANNPEVMACQQAAWCFAKSIIIFSGRAQRLVVLIAN